MTVVDSAAALTRVINDTTKEFDITEASLDAKVTSIQASETAAIADKVEAEGYRDTTAAHANTVATDLATVQSNLTYDGIAAILESKAVTAVDVFIYDTSLDSDGGAWRKRTQHTSWYNETLNTATRGGRREFPAVAVIVAEASKVTIYDGDDPSLPMWMVFNRPTSYATILWAWYTVTATGIAALNGTLALASTGSSRFKTVNFIDEVSYLWDISQSYKGNVPISERDSSWTNYVAITGTVLSREINDVAMTVLPDAPIDPATGLPVPTIAVATDSGVSVIKDDGNVWDITGDRVSDVDITSNGRLMVGEIHLCNFGPIPSADSTAGAWRDGYYSDGAYTPTVATLETTSTSGVLSGRAIGSVEGLVSLSENPDTPTNGMVAYATSTYNTGWMNGDIKGAFLADTDDTDLVGSGELVTNGTFDTDTSGWTEVGGTLSLAANKMRLTSSSGTAYSRLDSFSVTSGSVYKVSFDVSNITASQVQVWVGSGYNLANWLIKSGITSTQTVEAYFVAQGSVAYFELVINATTGQYADFDNISVKLADADRSVNNNGLIVNGTVTRSPVATGAELAAYSGFSASNYLEQPYNSALDFGTGDFCIMGWIKGIVGNHNRIFYRGGYVSNGIEFYYDNVYRIRVGSNKTASGGVRTDTWQQIIGLRRSGNLFLYMNGELISGPIDASTVNLDGSYPIEIGKNWAGSLALLRISATAPTADQIKKIYEDERKLFQPGAQCTLYGTSDAVTALAHDPKTNLLHVGTSAGRSTFNGLERIDNTTTPVTTAISAVNGLIAEQ